MFILVVFVVSMFFLGSCQEKLTEEKDYTRFTWEEIEQEAKGKTITIAMWKGDKQINKYMNNYVAPEVKRRWNIDLNIVNAQGNEIVKTLLMGKETQSKSSPYDMIWINGETFFQLRQIDALYGPFTFYLPNQKWIDWDNPFISVDFQQTIEGYECPWGNVQFSLIYNASMVKEPPYDMEDLAAWCFENPGKFTFPLDFTGMTFLKSWLIEFAGGGSALNGPFDEKKYEIISNDLWNVIKYIRPYMWKEGETFPNDIAQLHRLFANGEVAFTMSNNDSEVDNKINEGLFDTTAHAFITDEGTIQNSHYWGIPKNSAQKAAAFTVINFLISPEAQFEKAKPEIWGDGTVLSIQKLEKQWQEQFNQIPGRKHALPKSLLNENALQEPAPEYMIRMYEDFRKKFLDN